MEEYSLTDDEIPAELLAEANRINSSNSEYIVYYDADNGRILSITNEEHSEYANSFKVASADIEYLFQTNEILENYKVSIGPGNAPQIVCQNLLDSNLISFLKKVENELGNTDLVIKQNLLEKQWEFSLTEDKKKSLIDSGISGQFKFYLLDPANKNFIIRTIDINIKELYINKIYIVSFNSKQESNRHIKIETNNFLSSVGHYISNE